MLRTCLAINTAKAVSGLVNALHLGAGTSLPGKIARKIDPELLSNLGRQIRETTIAVTGTNGKTTTCGLLAQFLRESNKRVVHNQLGANMVPGITAALLNQSSLIGKLKADVGVLEVDEASLKGITAEVPVHQIVVTNLFRDQLDRYGELDTTARLIREGILKTGLISGQGRLILNADDPIVAGLGKDLPPDCIEYFGIQQVEYPNTPLVAETASDTAIVFPKETTYCPNCQAGLDYQLSIYGHLGHYTCHHCGYRRPICRVEAEHVFVTPSDSQIRLRVDEQRHEINLALPGLFNVYNFLAATASFVANHGLPEVIPQALTNYTSVFGRAERKVINGKTVMVMLIKNPVGASEVLKLVSGDPNGRLLVALNDQYADGRDVSWIWDAQFELLSAIQKKCIISGLRAEDMAVRLKYAGVPTRLLQVIPDLRQAVQQALHDTQPDEVLYILPTYTALLALRNIL